MTNIALSTQARRRRGIGVVTAVLGLLAVALGAFGAHALQELLERLGSENTYELANQYHFIHTLALLAVLARDDKFGQLLYLACGFWIAGVLLFSGSLYLLALTQIRWLAFLTPLGGVFLLLGWTVLIHNFYKTRS